ncbi:hypothetical protein T01_7383 [Trichinella spiralis]|uniref:Uncharacterized protein n=1 Tax=Trichinella spiralis TaxID=6334 RepID=A0A0V1BDS1_TRISP|nr:hypothetical protein T01_7383 [Trichinella spiralis]
MYQDVKYKLFRASQKLRRIKKKTGILHENIAFQSDTIGHFLYLNFNRGKKIHGSVFHVDERVSTQATQLSREIRNQKPPGYVCCTLLTFSD